MTNVSRFLDFDTVSNAVGFGAVRLYPHYISIKHVLTCAFGLTQLVARSCPNTALGLILLLHL
jgi:hypothetical protein